MRRLCACWFALGLRWCEGRCVNRIGRLPPYVAARSDERRVGGARRFASRPALEKPCGVDARLCLLAFGLRRRDRRLVSRVESPLTAASAASGCSSFD